MSANSFTRRDFLRAGAGLAAIGTASGALGLDALTHATSSVQGPVVPHCQGTDSEMAVAAQWARAFGPLSTESKTKAKTKLLPDPVKPPFSFIYGAESSTAFLPGWQREVKMLRVEDAKQQHEVTYTDPGTGLVVRSVVTVFEDFPAVESVIYLKNTGSLDTPILQDIQALDTPLSSSEGNPIIHYARGGACSVDDFMPITRVLGKRDRLRVSPGGGRSSSQFLPFFNIEVKGEGVILAIGWSGEWAASFDHPEDVSHFNVKAGMALTHLKLHPGEEIRTPRILMLFWQGEPSRGHNLLRKFLLTHHRPAVAGKPVTLPTATHNWGTTPAADHLENIRQIIAHDLPMDYYWIDAEWFGKGPWWRNVGNWEVNRELYPAGLKPISDLLHSAGRKFLLWFEPERVCEGTPWYTEHSQWLLDVPNEKRVYRGFGAKGEWDVSQSDPRWIPNESARNQIQENDRLFNLAIPEAREFLTNFISAKIDEYGVDCFRNDSNIAPLEFWRAADAPDRQGMTEIRWIEGLYSFWDELRRRHPNLLIDDCASGGRRIDLETIGRSVVLTRTDFVGDILANQCHSFGLLQWVPLNATSVGNLSTNNDYPMRSGMTGGLVYGLFTSGDVPQRKVNWEEFPFEEVKKSIEQYLPIQKYFYGDWYPLTEYTQSADGWMAYQLDLPDKDEGMVVVLKRPVSTYVRAVFRLNALRADHVYEITSLDTKANKTLTGDELMHKGLQTELLNQPDSVLLCYRRKS